MLKVFIELAVFLLMLPPGEAPDKEIPLADPLIFIDKPVVGVIGC